MKDEILKVIMEEVRKNYYKDTSLLLSNVMILFVINSIDDFLEKIIISVDIRIIIYLLLLLIWDVIWLFNKYKLPKTKKGFIGIIICIDTENKLTEEKLKVDLFKKIRDSIHKNSLSDLIHPILLKQHQVKMVTDVLKEYSGALNRIMNGGKITKNEIKRIKKWVKTQKNINGNFFIWGDIKERIDGKEKYFFSLDCLTVFNPVDPKTRSEIEKDVRSIWPKNINFLKESEFKGFNFSADYIYLASKFIVGLSAYHSNNPELALELHENVEKEYKKNYSAFPNYQITCEKLKSMISNDLLIISRKLYFNKQSLADVKKYLELSIEKNPENYEAYIFQSFILFEEERDINVALTSVNNAERTSRGNLIWRYNKAFLLMYKGAYEEALKIYRKISKTTFENELKLLGGIIAHIENILKKETDKIQYYFVIGYLNYKKIGNYPEAWVYFTKFLKKARQKKDYQFLTQKTKAYINDIECEMDKK